MYIYMDDNCMYGAWLYVSIIDTINNIVIQSVWTVTSLSTVQNDTPACESLYELAG